jgi:hypothetical protein
MQPETYGKFSMTGDQDVIRSIMYQMDEMARSHDPAIARGAQSPTFVLDLGHSDGRGEYNIGTVYPRVSSFETIGCSITTGPNVNSPRLTPVSRPSSSRIHNPGGPASRSVYDRTRVHTCDYSDQNERCRSLGPDLSSFCVIVRDTDELERPPRRFHTMHSPCFKQLMWAALRLLYGDNSHVVGETFTVNGDPVLEVIFSMGIHCAASAFQGLTGNGEWD